jgi:hypothetical protein
MPTIQQICCGVVGKSPVSTPFAEGIGSRLSIELAGARWRRLKPDAVGIDRVNPKLERISWIGPLLCSNLTPKSPGSFVSFETDEFSK